IPFYTQHKRQPDYQAKRKTHHKYHAKARCAREGTELFFNEYRQGIAKKKRRQPIELLAPGRAVRRRGSERCGLGCRGVVTEIALELLSAEPPSRQGPAYEDQQRDRGGITQH